MTEKVLLIKIEDESQTVDTVKVIPLKVQKEIAEFDISCSEFVKMCQEDKDLLNTYIPVTYLVSGTNINIDPEDSFDVIVNNKLEVHICCNDVGYNVDLYKVYEGSNEEHDYDGDYITTCTAFFDDLE